MEAANHLEHLGQLHDRVRQWQPWVRSLAEVADNLGVDPSRGLDRLDALSRQRRFGPNVPVDLSQNLGFFKVFMEEIAEPMMLLLLSVGVLYSIWGEPWDAATIFVTILVVIGLEVFTEWRAKRALASLMNSVPTNTSVLRDGREGVVAADELVPGDVLLLAHGQSVPADAVVAVCHGFSVDESMLTGESVNVYKAALGTGHALGGNGNESGNINTNIAPDNGESHYSIESEDDGFPNYDELQEIPPTLVCAGTTVTSGRAVCIVVATGSHTEIAANIARLMKGGKPPPTPLQRRMKKLAGSLSLVAIAVCVLITLVGLLKGMEWRTAILMGMSLAFATIPEELPLIAKASLALGARQLARHKLLVRRLTAADALASVSVIVTDKTGTLTRNQLVVSSVLAISSDGSDGDALAVEVITPEAISASEKSAALAAPLYAAWSLSVDPLEAKPLAQFLESVETKSSGRSSIGTPARNLTVKSRAKSTGQHLPGKGSVSSGGSAFRPLRGFGKDFMNSAVLQSLLGAEDSDSGDLELPRDPATDNIPLLTIAESISIVCERLPEPSGELPFDATLRISARTRSPAKVPISFDARGGTKAKQDEAATAASSSSATPTRQKHWTVVKGAPETLLPMCDRVWKTTATGVPVSVSAVSSGNVDGIQEMSESFSQTVSRSATKLAVGGSRVIAYAIAITDGPLFSTKEGEADRAPQEPGQAGGKNRRWSTSGSQAFRFRDPEASASSATTAELPGGAATLDRGASAQQALPTDLVFVGAFAFFDPPQREAKPVLQECQDAGIRVIMATGDHPSTALAVANAVGITEGHAPPDPSSGPQSRSRAVSRGSYDAIGGLKIQRGNVSPSAPAPSEIHAVTGEMVQKSLSNGTFEQLIDESNVFARVTPAQKLRLVHSLQARGEVVAFIGDGINDAPSLTRADVGICMGGNPSTADVAMDSASLIVLSGKFSGVVRSLREGHRLSANIDKCLVFYIACKLAIVALFAFLLIVEGASPMTPVQVIFIELFTDLGATWTFLTERPEGIPRRAAEPEASLTALELVRDATGGGSRSDASGYLGFGKATDRAVVFYGALLFATCALPLIIPSVLLPSWAVAPVAPTLTFLTWMAAHSLLGNSMRTKLVPLRVHDGHSSAAAPHASSIPSLGALQLQPELQQQLLLQGNGGLRARINIPGIAWVTCSLLAVVLASTITPVSAHLGIVQLDAVEWVMVVLSPLLLFGGLELSKEIRFARFKRDHHIRYEDAGDDAALGGDRRPLISG